MSQNLTRRRFLLSGSSLIALPLLESLIPARAFAQASAQNRAIFMKFPIGVFKNSWRPTGTGTNYTLPAQLASLETFKSDIILPLGLNQANGSVDGAGDHARSGGCYLTCVRINKSEQDIRAATSIDRLIAERLNLTANPKWLVLAAPGQGWGDSGYGSAYTSNISWISPTTPASRITDTREAFNALFPDAGSPDPSADAARRARLKKSILDGAVAEANALSMRLSAADRVKLDEYLSSVREVEKSIADDSVNNPMACNPGTDPGSTSNDFAKFTRTMMDLIVLASTCDRTKVVSYFLDYEGTNRATAGVTQGHHTVSHHTDNAAYPDQYRTISKWYADQFAYFLGRMKNTRDSMNRPLLDSSLIVFGSDIHDGNEHGHRDLPIIVAGRANGTVTPGRVLDTGGRPIANLWTAVADRMGTNITTFGDSNGIISL